MPTPSRPPEAGPAGARTDAAGTRTARAWAALSPRAEDEVAACLRAAVDPGDVQDAWLVYVLTEEARSLGPVVDPATGSVLVPLLDEGAVAELLGADAARRARWVAQRRRAVERRLERGEARGEARARLRLVDAEEPSTEHGGTGLGPIEALDLLPVLLVAYNGAGTHPRRPALEQALPGSGGTARAYRALVEEHATWREEAAHLAAAMQHLVHLVRTAPPLPWPRAMHPDGQRAPRVAPLPALWLTRLVFSMFGAYPPAQHRSDTGLMEEVCDVLWSWEYPRRLAPLASERRGDLESLNRALRAVLEE